MRVFDLIALMDAEVTAASTKVHLAVWNGIDNPLDLYLAGKFEEWQREQTQRNFERSFVIALIKLPTANRWLFAGAYNSQGCDRVENPVRYHYRLDERSACAEMNGRVVAKFRRTGRQSYLNAENWVDQILLGEILPERLKIGEFPGYRAVNLSKEELDLIVRQGLESWRTALSNVAGVYLISDTATGKLYVGSATGEGGIWQRWVQYSATGHCDNVELRGLIKGAGIERASAFRFSVLEIADIHESTESVLRRESHWKSILLTRGHGFNAN